VSPGEDEARERLAVMGEIAAEVAHELRNVLQVISASAYVARQEAARGDASAALPHVAKIEPHDLRVRAHPGLLARLFHVLYENAIHATAPRAPRIVTRAGARDGRVTIDVVDDGPGIPEHIAAHVFEPLVSARPGGTGLGLALARRIAAAHGGSLTLVAGGPGATFRLELPGV
jgi:signal transduction histidine kinase